MNPEIAKVLSPLTPKTHAEVSERARSLVVPHFNSRGRFTLLEEQSHISSAQWRNFYYGRQRINEKMLSFVIDTFPSAKNWILTGKSPAGQALAPYTNQTNLPFGIALPTEFETAGQRLNWVIQQWTPARGRELLTFLTELSVTDGKAISTEEWSKVILKNAEPTIAMVAAICKRNRRFALWILCGPFEVHDHWGPFGLNDQIDPSNRDCVSDFQYWDEMREEQLESETGIPSKYKEAKLEPKKKSRETKKNGNKKG